MEVARIEGDCLILKNTRYHFNTGVPQDRQSSSRDVGVWIACRNDDLGYLGSYERISAWGRATKKRTGFESHINRRAFRVSACSGEGIGFSVGRAWTTVKALSNHTSILDNDRTNAGIGVGLAALGEADSLAQVFFVHAPQARRSGGTSIDLVARARLALCELFHLNRDGARFPLRIDGAVAIGDDT